eukprot:g3068.t1 g3068   contig12:1351833-1353166(-)
MSFGGGRGRGRGSGRGGSSKPPSNSSPGSQPKLQVCRNFASTGNCHHGDRCNFSHVVKMHASIVASDKNPDAKPSYSNYHGGRGGGGKSKDLYKVTSVAVWETNGAIKLFTGSHDGKGGSSPGEAPDAKAGMVHTWNLNAASEPPLELCLSPMAKYAGSGRIRSLWTTVDGRVWSGGTDGVIRQWAFSPTGGPTGTGGFALVRSMESHLGAVTGITLVGTMLWSGGMDGTIRLWNVDSGDCAHLIPAVKKDTTNATSGGAQAPPTGHSGPVTGLLPFEAPNNQGSFVFSSSLDDTVKVWNATNGECVASESHGQGVTSIALTSDLKGNPLLLCGLFYGDIMVRGTISSPPLVLLLKLSHQYIGVGHELGPVNDIQAGPGNTFYAVADDGKLTVWQITGDFGL